jgi:yersiniabactin nonribosomal peptide synthetase
LPIDPDIPPSRMQYLLKNGEVRVAITQSSLEKSLALPEGLVQFALDRALEDIPSLCSFVELSSDALAYVIYTSGSTGAPKGVMINHRAAVNTILDINSRFAVTHGDRLLALSSLTFDLSVYDVFGTLAAGGTVVFPAACHQRDPAHWLRRMRTSGVTIWNSAPALMQMMLEYLKGSGERFPDCLRLVLLSGDWIPVDLPDAIRALAPSSRVISLGGATEASIWSILFPIDTIDPEWKSIPYGSPMQNQRVHVLDFAGEPCPDWTVGELFIGGSGLAVGYWKDSVKTAAHFIESDLRGERLYRTGDWGRFVPRGYIEFLGRRDSQVKISGHRIELGEVEDALLRHPRIKDAVVVAREDEPGRKALVAYFTLHRQVLPDSHSLRPASVPERSEFWEDVERSTRLHHTLAEIDVFKSALETAEDFATLTIHRFFWGNRLFRFAGEEVGFAELADKCKVTPKLRPLFARWLRFLMDDGVLVEPITGTYLCQMPIEEPEVLRIWEDLAPQLSSTPALREYLRGCAENVEELLRGRVDPVVLLFPKGSWKTAEELYETNPVADFVNKTAGMLLHRIAGEVSVDGKLRVLEVGAGVGSTSTTILPVLPPDRTEYWFTDVSEFFLSGAKQKFSRFPFLHFGILDINAERMANQWPPFYFDCIIAANVLHNATDLRSSLERLRLLLAPNGLLLLIEATRNTRVQAITVSFIESLAQLPRRQPFLSTETWCEELIAAGFKTPALLPDMDLGVSVVAAQAPSPSDKEIENAYQTHSTSLTEEEVKAHLRSILPLHMIPRRVVPLESLPLNRNGKVERTALPRPEPLFKSQSAGAHPQTDLEKRIAKTWAAILTLKETDVYQNFFDAGGDSLMVIQLQQALQHDLGMPIEVVDIFRYPTIRSLAARLCDQNEKDIDFADLQLRIGQRRAARLAAERNRDCEQR